MSPKKIILGCTFFLLSSFTLWADEKEVVKSPVEQAIVPFLAKHCTKCHGPEKKKADLVLHVYKDEASILKNRKVWQEIGEQIRSGEMPPPKQPRPSSDEIETFLRAARGVFEKADLTGKRDPGHVTMRRLNRVEYANTIHDLIGITFQASDDFPSDDVGFGFDNIGDVLTISPLLMERYLSAAEWIAQKAVIVGDPPKVEPRVRNARILEPKLRRFGADNIKVRSVTANSEQLYTTFEVDESTAYVLKVKAYGKQVGDDQIKFALEVDDNQVHTFTLQSKDEASAQVLDFKLNLKKGTPKVGVRLLNEYADPNQADNKRTLFVTRISLEGPFNYPVYHRQIMAHKADVNRKEAAREIVTRIANRAYRRPAKKDEINRLLKLVDQSEKQGESLEEGIQLALQAILVSPHFLFRVELDRRPDSLESHPVDDYQLASRLSYFMWNTMPDEELFDLAKKKALHANLDAQARRMLKDSRSRSLVENFAMQWLQLRTLKGIIPDRKLFPDFDESLRISMQKETEHFIDAIFREDRSILEMIDSDFTFLNERLARHYGIGDTKGNPLFREPVVKGGEPIKGKEFVRVALANSERGGILTHASILAVTSNPTRTSPVKRGRWILEQILGTPPPPPPPDAPELPEGDKVTLKGSLRQRMEQHRADPVCANCHARMDPIGFAFENYDPVGKFRKTDGEFSIDPSGILPDGQSFNGPTELKQILKNKKDLFARCLTEKMLTYALGRGLEYYDKAAVDRIVAQLDRNDYKVSTLISEITRSDPFRLRRGKDSNP